MSENNMCTDDSPDQKSCVNNFDEHTRIIIYHLVLTNWFYLNSYSTGKEKCIFEWVTLVCLTLKKITYCMLHMVYISNAYSYWI